MELQLQSEDLAEQVDLSQSLQVVKGVSECLLNKLLQQDLTTVNVHEHVRQWLHLNEPVIERHISCSNIDKCQEMATELKVCAKPTLHSSSSSFVKRYTPGTYCFVNTFLR